MGDRLRAWIENPVIVKHVRTRLRPQAASTSLVVVVLLNLCLAYAGFALDWYRSGAVAGCIVAMQFIILTIIGGAQVGASVNGARASGILDFHRVSPLTSTELALGFFFGAPIREYALFAATIPFTALCMAFGVPSFRGFVQLMIAIVTTSWTVHALGVLNGLVSRSRTPSGSIVGVVVFLFFFFSFIISGAQFSVDFVENDHRLGFFGISLPWLPVALLYQLPLLFFLLLAATRKMESQRLHPLSRPQAIAAMLVCATLVLGGSWRQEGYEVVAIAVLYLLTIPAIVLSALVTPTQAEYAKGLYRAQKQGRTRLPWWDDLSVNWVPMAILSAIVLVAGTLAGTVAAGAPAASSSRSAGSYPLALAAAVLTSAYFGLASQYFHLRFGKRGVTYFGLFLFIFWLLPLLAGSIQSMAYSPSAGQAGYPLFALSPVAGIGMVAAVRDDPIAYAVQAASLTPVLLFTSVFNYLLVGARRRVMRSVFLAGAGKRPPEVEIEPAATTVGAPGG